MDEYPSWILKWPRIHRFWHHFSTSPPISPIWGLLAVLANYFFLYPNLILFPILTHPETNEIVSTILKYQRNACYFGFIPIRLRLILFLIYFFITTVAFALGIFKERLLFNNRFNSYLHISVESILTILIMIIPQNFYPVFESYRKGNLEMLYVIIYIIDLLLAITFFTLVYFFTGQSIYVPDNFFAVWDTWNLYYKYITPTFLPCWLLIQNEDWRLFCYCSYSFLVPLTCFIVDFKLPFLARTFMVSYFFFEFSLMATAVIGYITIKLDHTFRFFMLNITIAMILIAINVGSLYNYFAKRYTDYLISLNDDDIDAYTGFPKRFLTDLKIIDSLRFIASFDGEQAKKIARYLMLNSCNCRIHMEGVRILIILDQLNSEIAKEVLNIPIDEVPWHMRQCLCDSQFEAIAYLSQNVSYETLKQNYSNFENDIKTSLIGAVDQIIEEDFDNFMSKTSKYIKSCDELEFYTWKITSVVTGSPSFYDRIRRYYEIYKGDYLMSEIYKYRKLYVSELNRKIKIVKAIQENNDSHFISLRLRVNSINLDTKQIPKLKIHEAVKDIEPYSIKQARANSKIIIFLLFSVLVFIGISLAMISNTEIHMFFIHNIITSRMIPLYKLTTKLASLVNEQANISIVYSEEFYKNESLVESIYKVSNFFAKTEDVFILVEKLYDIYYSVATKEKRYQLQMHQVIHVFDNGINELNIDYLYEIVHDVDNSVNDMIDSILSIRVIIDNIYYNLCIWIPLSIYILFAIILLMNYHQLRTKFKNEMLLIWNLLLEKNVSSLEKYKNQLMYEDTDDILLDDDEIDVENNTKIELVTEKSNERKIDLFNISTLLMLTFIVVSFVAYFHFLKQIVYEDFYKNRETFMNNQAFQKLFIMATDIMMSYLRKNERSSRIKSKIDYYHEKNLEIVRDPERIHILERFRQEIIDYLGNYSCWYHDGKQINENFLHVTNVAFEKALNLIYSNVLNCQAIVNSSIRHMKLLILALTTSYIFFSIIYYFILNLHIDEKVKRFNALKSMMQILPSQNISPQSQLIMTFTNIKNHKNQRIQNKTIIKSYPEAIVTVSKEGMVEKLNSSFENLIELNKHMMIGRKISDFIEEFELFTSKHTSSNVTHFNSYLLGKEKIPVSCSAMFIEQRMCVIVKDRRNEIERSNHLRQAKNKVEQLLSKILPRQMKIKILGKQEKLYSQIDRSTIIFIGIDDFLGWCKLRNHHEIMELLDVIFRGFDDKIKKYKSLTKLKTINGTYMVASGLFESKMNQEVEAVEFCLECAHQVIERTKKKKVFDVKLNIGINTGGPIITGILGDELPMFDIWGDAVNVASRLETSCPPNHIQMSLETKELLPSGKYEFIEVHDVYLKGKGLKTVFRIAL